jgi:hypothetical protein
MRDAPKWRIIYAQLDKTGEISRNFALRRYISRLAARIDDLKRWDWDFREERRKGDYVYIVTKRGTNHLEEARKPRQLALSV